MPWLPALDPAQAMEDVVSHEVRLDGAVLTFEDRVLDELARRVASLLDHREPSRERFIGVDDAADLLNCGKARIYSLVGADRMPHHRDGSRLLFRRSELEQWVQDGGATRP
jgi:excisionase family DNA binding protein